MARLRWTQKSWQRSKESFLTIICACAPIARAPAGVKFRLLEQLQDVLDGVPNSDFLVLVGDFYAQVSVFNPQDDLWHGIVGGYGIEERSFAGVTILSV